MLQAKLVVVGGGSSQAQEIKLRLPAIIGRGRGATLKVPLSLISRKHCEIREQDGRLYIRDLGSLNGTYINNYKISSEQPLLPGELVTVGTVTFRAEYQLPPTNKAAAKVLSPAQGGRKNQTEAATAASEQVVFMPPGSEPRGTHRKAAPQFDSTVAGNLSVSVTPGQPVKIREQAAASADAAKDNASKKPGAKPGAAKLPKTAKPPQTAGSPAGSKPIPAQPASGRPLAPRSAAKPRLEPKVSKWERGAPENGVLLDDFPLDVTPQKSISLSALDELSVTGPRQVSFIGDLSFGERPLAKVEEAVAIEPGSEVHPINSPAAERDSRLDSFLRGLDRPAE